MELKVREKDFVKKNITTQSLISLFSAAFLYLIFFFTKSCGTFISLKYLILIGYATLSKIFCVMMLNCIFVWKSKKKR